MLDKERGISFCVYLKSREVGFERSLGNLAVGAIAQKPATHCQIQFSADVVVSFTKNFHSATIKSSGYLTVPALPSNAFSVNSIAIKALSGTSNGHLMPHSDAFLKPNLG